MEIFGLSHIPLDKGMEIFGLVLFLWIVASVLAGMVAGPWLRRIAERHPEPKEVKRHASGSRRR